MYPYDIQIWAPERFCLNSKDIAEVLPLPGPIYLIRTRARSTIQLLEFRWTDLLLMEELVTLLWRRIA